MTEQEFVDKAEVALTYFIKYLIASGIGANLFVLLYWLGVFK